MTDHSITLKPTCPNTINGVPLFIFEPIGIPEQPTLLGSILGAVVSRVADSSEVTPTFRPMVVSENFTLPRYSAARLQLMHMILCVRDAEVLRLEQDLTDILEAFKTKQQALTNALTPLRQCLVKPEHLVTRWNITRFETLAPHSVVNLPDVRRFESAIKDRTIAALYKATLQTVKRLTRGKR
jgi:hypothetical protein